MTTTAAAKVKTLERVIAAQSGRRQKWVVETIAGRVQKRVQAGQNQETAMREVLAQFETWALEELQRRQASK